IDKTSANTTKKKNNINPQTVTITMKEPTTFDLLYTKTVPNIAKIQNINADQPKPVILLLPVLLKADSNSPKIQATMAPRNPKTLPIKPRTNYVVLPNERPSLQPVIYYCTKNAIPNMEYP